MKRVINVNEYINYNYKKAVKKPNTIEKNDFCPFCKVDKLTNIIYQQEGRILLENKFKTIKDAEQFVIIETNLCNKNMLNYTKKEMFLVINFAISNWIKLSSSGKYKSVILFKNHGKLSGGSIKHSHMQIIGFNNLNYIENINKEYFYGSTIFKNSNLIINISNTPKITSTEFNIIIIDKINNYNHELIISDLAKSIQLLIKYICEDFYIKCESFNIFFYEFKNKIICKIIPRFITSPIYIGYNLIYLSNLKETIIKDLIEKTSKLL